MINSKDFDALDRRARIKRHALDAVIYVILGISAGCAIPFGLALVEVLKGEEEADRIAQQIVIR